MVRVVHRPPCGPPVNHSVPAYVFNAIKQHPAQARAGRTTWSRGKQHSRKAAGRLGRGAHGLSGCMDYGSGHIRPKHALDFQVSSRAPATAPSDPARPLALGVVPSAPAAALPAPAERQSRSSPVALPGLTWSPGLPPSPANSSSGDTPRPSPSFLSSMFLPIVSFANWRVFFPELLSLEL